MVNTHLSANKDGDWSAGNRYHAFQRAQLEVLHRARELARRSAGADAGPTVVTATSTSPATARPARRRVDVLHDMLRTRAPYQPKPAGEPRLAA